MPEVYLVREDVGRLVANIFGSKPCYIFVPGRCVMGYFPESALENKVILDSSKLFGKRLLFYDDDQKRLTTHEKAIAKYPSDIVSHIDITEDDLVKVTGSIQVFLREKAAAEKQVTDLFYQILMGKQKDDLSKR